MGAANTAEHGSLSPEGNDLAKVAVVDLDFLRTLMDQQELVVFAYLFGSHARGDSSPLSDLDIAAYFRGGSILAWHEGRIGLYLALSRGLGINDIDIVVLNTASNLIVLDAIIRSGIILVDREPDERANFELRVLHQAIDFKTQRRAFLGV